jgi:hypothetical protein
VHHYDLDNPERFVKVLDIEVPWAHTYADTEPGRTDRERRDNYRKAAVSKLSPLPAAPLWWAFRIGVEKVGRALDVDNVAKTIIDSFCTWQINRDVRDGSPPAGELGLFPDDTIDHVRVLQVDGARGTANRTQVEIFACMK